MSLGNNIYDALGEKGHPYQSTSAKMGKSGKALLIRYSRNLFITLHALGYNHMKQSKKTLLLKKKKSPDKWLSVGVAFTIQKEMQ